MFKFAVCALALATSNMAMAQHAGHTMPKPEAKKPAGKKAPAKKAPAKKPAAKKKPGAKKPVAKAPAAVDHEAMGHGQAEPTTSSVAPQAEPATPVDHSQMGHGQPAEPSPGAVDHSQMDHGQPAQTAPGAVDHSEMGEGGQGSGHATHGGMTAEGHAGTAAGEGMAGHQMQMTGALGPYPLAREASGTSWQPDTSEHDGLHVVSGDWTLMAHGTLDLVYSWQEQPRGDSKVFPAGMLMGMARRSLGDGTLQFKAMVSPDPVMGKRGYPLLLASGETANGVDPLVDRQHPHDFFMELSASISQNIGPKSSVFLYAGLPGEPAFGPPAFMHRQSISTSPEAPISHHWLDSTHITFGVVTAGLVHDNFKVEASRFNGREPDQHRWNIETGPLDSTSARLSWNPTRTLSLQGSWAHLKDPEQLEPGVDQRRWTASGSYTRPMANGWWATTLAWGRKTLEGESFDAFALESSLKWKDWTLFGRGEITENNELVTHEEEGEEEHHGEAFRVGKISIGVVRDFSIGPHFKLGLGGLYAFNFVPGEIESVYGGDPNGAMAFVRLKID